MEVLNGDSEWRAAGLGLSGPLRSTRESSFRPPRCTQAPDAALRMWDSTACSARHRWCLWGGYPRPHRAVAQAVHSLPLLRGFLFGCLDSRSPPIGSFPRAAKDSRMLLEALRSGRLHVGLDRLAPADGFSFVLSSRSGRTFAMGERALGGGPRGPRLGPNAEGNGGFPAAGRAGAAEGNQRAREPLDAPGVYRVEAHVPGWTMPWVITNPINVFSSEIHATRARRASWPGPERAPESTTVLDSFDAPSPFVAEADERSPVTYPHRPPGRGARRRGSGTPRLSPWVSRAG